ncbi:MAG TPA: LexA family transcriptional regulator [Flavobacteriaceae bacterium]|nr:LexA family transcriptional regulator [Flavobacteriaceae bacterium]
MDKELHIKRFKEVREDHHFTQTEFAEKLGIKNTTADIERGRTKLSGEVIKELLKQFNINPLWIFGESHQKFLNLNQVNLMPKVITTDTEGNDNMVLVNQRAAAGYPQNIQESGWHKKLPAFNLPLPEFRNATYRGFQVEGNSMEPNLRAGEWVLGKAVDNLSDVNEGKIYVIITYDSVLVKKLYRLPNDSSKIRLVSINTEYPPLEMKVTEIQELWQVNSKLTFSLNANAENSILQELQESMEELKRELQSFKERT